ncbi:MAG: DNA repair protein RecO [Ignavibacteriales bacterium]|nr:DNA repair protein RecO [Ignavibacteriales bacterium]
MIVRTDAVVLKSMRFRDTSKIVTFYTRKFGKLAAVAKGAREPKSKFGAALEPMTEVHLVLYKKDQRDLQLVSQCDILRPFKTIHSEMPKMEAAMSVLELLHQLTHDEEENPALYRLVTDTLEAVEQAEKNVYNFVYAFELRFSALFGFSPSFDRCASCGRPAAENNPRIAFRIDRGGLLCSACAEARPMQRGTGRRLSGAATIKLSTAQILHRLLTARLDSLSSLGYHESVGNELDETLRSYLRYHFEQLRPLKSAGVFRMMSPGGHR